jgi:hypothetical protein
MRCGLSSRSVHHRKEQHDARVQEIEGESRTAEVAASNEEVSCPGGAGGVVHRAGVAERVVGTGVLAAHYSGA